MREIKTPRGIFSVPNYDFTSGDAKENGYSYYFTSDYGDIYVKHLDQYHCNFVLVKPYLEKFDVPEDVKTRICKYLENDDLGELCHVQRMSNHPDDHYLYGVIVKRKNDFACWTCWNETSKCLNYGHYGLKDLTSCIEILKEYYHDCKKCG